jgi:DNA-binding transcriptional ArsR family regulator
MELEQAAKQLEALGNKTRLTIYRDLVEAGRQGNTVGEINERLDIPPSTLSHHISKLVQTGLVSQERVSRSLVCSAEFENMESLIMFLASNCCADDSSIWG